VGPLQFEVVQYRLKSEYGAESRLETAPWTVLRWVDDHPDLKDRTGIVLATGVSFGSDTHDRTVVLFPNDWTMGYFREKNPGLVLRELPARSS
jgi:peptide chain release factor 3